MKKWLLWALLVLTVVNLRALDILTYENYLSLIEEKLPELKQADNAVLAAENHVDKARSAYDGAVKSRLYGSGSQQHSASIDYDYSPGFGGNVNVTHTLPSGTELQYGFSYDQSFLSGVRKTNNESFTRTTYDPHLSLEITQPVLYNWFGFLTRYGVEEKRDSLKIARVKAALDRERELNFYKRLYYNWIAYGAMLDLYERTIENARELEAQTREKLAIGLTERDTAASIEYSVISYEQQVLTTRHNYEKLLNEFAFFFNPDDYRPDTGQLDLIYREVVDRDLIYIDFERTRSAKMLNLTRTKLEALKKADKNRTLPALDLFGSVDISFKTTWEMGNDVLFYDNDDSNVDFTAGITLTFPPAGKGAKEALKETELMIADLVHEYDKSAHAYDVSLNNVIKYHTYALNLMRLKQTGLDKLELKYKLLWEKHRQGRASLKDLIDTDNSITRDRIDMIKMKTDIILNTLQYTALTQ